MALKIDYDTVKLQKVTYDILWRLTVHLIHHTTLEETLKMLYTQKRTQFYECRNIYYDHST